MAPNIGPVVPHALRKNPNECHANTLDHLPILLTFEVAFSKIAKPPPCARPGGGVGVGSGALRYAHLP